MLPDLSRSRLQKLIRAGACRVNGEIVTEADFRLNGEEELTLEMADSKSGIAAEDGEIKIIWRDNDLAVCDKQPGLVTHPCPSCPENTLTNRLLAHFPQLAEQDGDRPGIVHRLDKDTSGLLLIALNEKSRMALAADFAERKIHKQYLALVAGKPPDKGECLQPIGRHPTIKTRMAIVGENHGGRPAHSRWRRLWTSPDESASLLALKIFTGRTHQIRVHLAHAGHPILGDVLYAPAPVKNMAPRQMLHAWRISLRHPENGDELEFMAPPPQDFYDTALAHALQPRAIVITGSQGCGKSTFSGELRKLGIPVASADDLVAKMYRGPNHVTDWLLCRFGNAALNNNDSVNKPVLLEFLRKDPALRTEFEHMIHALVLDEIENFWLNVWREGKAAAGAEIPLYFECGWDKIIKPRPFAIGVYCPRESRWRRIAENRGWSEEKIATLENWQWPEERKMAQCDFVANNCGPEANLVSAAKMALEKFADEEKARRENMVKVIKTLCGEGEK